MAYPSLLKEFNFNIMITEQKIASLLKQCQNIKTSSLKIKEIVDCSRGCDQEVKIVKYSGSNKSIDSKVVIKYPKSQPDKILNQKVGCSCASKMGVPVPQIYFTDCSFLVESFIEGKILKEVQTSERIYKKMYKNLGSYLKLIHQNKGKGYGKLRSELLVGQHKNTDKIRQNIQSEITALKKSNQYSNEFMNKIQKYCQQKQHLLKTGPKQTSLLHGDYCQDNILADERQIKAIVDFGDLAMGQPMQDFARLYIKHYGTYKWDFLISGYGTHNLELIEFYTVYFCLWRINSELDKNKHYGPIRQFEKVLKRIINKI